MTDKSIGELLALGVVGLIGFVLIAIVLTALLITIGGAVGWGIVVLFSDVLGFSTILSPVDGAIIGAIVSILGRGFSYDHDE